MQGTPTFPASDDPDFAHVISLCTQLTAECAALNRSRLVALVVLAQCELTEYGREVPRALHHVAVDPVGLGLIELEASVDVLMRSSDLTRCLWLTRARELVRLAIREASSD